MDFAAIDARLLRFRKCAHVTTILHGTHARKTETEKLQTRKKLERAMKEGGSYMCLNYFVVYLVDFVSWLYLQVASYEFNSKFLIIRNLWIRVQFPLTQIDVRTFAYTSWDWEMYLRTKSCLVAEEILQEPSPCFATFNNNIPILSVAMQWVAMHSLVPNCIYKTFC
jgi:hypothetical protein